MENGGSNDILLLGVSCKLIDVKGGCLVASNFVLTVGENKSGC